MQRAAQVRKLIFFSKSAAKKGQRDNEAIEAMRQLRHIIIIQEET